MDAASVRLQEDVDYILVSNKSLDPQRTADRDRFEDGLKLEGLRLEREEIGNLIFTKINLPDDVKFKYFEILELRMPLVFPDMGISVQRLVADRIRVSFLYYVQKVFCLKSIQIGWKCLRNYYLHENDDMDEIEKQFLLCFKLVKLESFNLESEYAKKKIWKILVVHYILSRQQWRDEDPYYTGIEMLIDQKIYTSAFPLHDGNYTEKGTTRNNLYKSWDSFHVWKKLPSLDDMRDYMGNKCAIYFAWLEFYTKMLLPASVFGIFLILYGVITLSKDKFGEDVCKAENVIMCPLCDDKACGYYRMSDNCIQTRVTYLFDNNFSIVYSILMALWASVLIGLWKRRMAVLERKWNILDSKDEKPRMEYIRQLKKYRQIKGNANAKNIPWSMRFAAYFISSSILLFFILLILIAVVSISVYQFWIAVVVYSTNEDMTLSEYGKFGFFILSFTSSLLNLITIKSLNYVYNKVAVFLNDLELHRTQSEYDRALTFKNFIFQFINTYASIFHVALFKGKFVGNPNHYNRILGHRHSECKNGCCFMELNIQLAVIMVGNQIINYFKERITKSFRGHLKRLFSNRDAEQQSKLSESVTAFGEQYESVKMTASRWEEDNQLLDYEKEGGLFNEYLELTIQYGFVILFAPAFPLAPLFACIRNVFAIRQNAKKILTLYRRLVPHLNPNMKIWMNILNIIGVLAVQINAFVIAFSTNFIPYQVYKWMHNGDGGGYFNATLSGYYTLDLDQKFMPESSNVTVCYYTDFRKSYWSQNKYDPTELYWYIWIAKLTFIIFYQTIIFMMKKIILKWIPKTPGRLYRFQKKESNFLFYCEKEKVKSNYLLRQKIHIIDHRDIEQEDHEETVEYIDETYCGYRKCDAMR